MKYFFTINQAGVVRLSLLGRVDLPSLCLLDYLGGWFFCDKAKRATVDGKEFIWLQYAHAVEELPLLFNPGAALASRKNQLARLVQALREAGLVESVKFGRDLYLRPSDLAASLATSRERTITKSTPAVTPPHDGVVTPARDGNVTSEQDDCGSPISIETTTTETNIRESSTPQPPLQGEAEAEAIMLHWNSTTGLQKVQRLTGRRLKTLHKRFGDEFFRSNWRVGIERIARSPFCTGGGERGWRANLDWFLRADTLTKVIEGAYDGLSGTAAPRHAPPRHFDPASYTQSTKEF